METVWRLLLTGYVELAPAPHRMKRKSCEAIIISRPSVKQKRMTILSKGDLLASAAAEVLYIAYMSDCWCTQ